MSMSRGGDIFDPFGTFTDLLNPGNVGGSSPFPHSRLSGRNPVAFSDVRIDWRETAHSHVFRADLPGVKKEEVEVEVEDGRVLKISGERSEEKEDKSDTWHRLERSRGKFLRRFNLPEGAKVDQVKAAMENGVLTVTVPKVEAKPRLRSIEITG